jgi:hypothetical protein
MRVSNVTREIVNKAVKVLPDKINKRVYSQDILDAAIQYVLNTDKEITRGFIKVLKEGTTE